MTHRKKQELGMFLAIVFICFLIAAVFSFVTGELPSLIDRMISRRVAKEIERVKREAQGLSSTERERIKRLLEESYNERR